MPSFAPPATPTADSVHSSTGPHSAIQTIEVENDLYFQEWHKRQPPVHLTTAADYFRPRFPSMKIMQCVSFKFDTYFLTDAGKVSIPHTSQISVIQWVLHCQVIKHTLAHYGTRHNSWHNGTHGRTTELFPNKVCIKFVSNQLCESSNPCRNSQFSSLMVSIFDDGTAATLSDKGEIKPLQTVLPETAGAIVDAHVHMMQYHSCYLLVRTSTQLFVISLTYWSLECSLLAETQDAAIYSGNSIVAIGPQGVSKNSLCSVYTAVLAGELMTRLITQPTQPEGTFVSSLARVVSDEQPADVFCKVETGSQSPVIQISAGRDHVLAVTSSGQLLGFGSTDSGKLGCGVSSNLLDAPRVLLGKDAKIIRAEAGHEHSIVVTADGRVLSSGKRAFGRLGTHLKEGTQTRFAEMDCKVYTSAKAQGLVPVDIRLTMCATSILFGKQSDTPEGKIDEPEGSTEGSTTGLMEHSFEAMNAYLESMPNSQDKSALLDHVFELRGQLQDLVQEQQHDRLTPITKRKEGSARGAAAAQSSKRPKRK